MDEYEEPRHWYDPVLALNGNGWTDGNFWISLLAFVGVAVGLVGGAFAIRGVDYLVSDVFDWDRMLFWVVTCLGTGYLLGRVCH